MKQSSLPALNMDEEVDLCYGQGIPRNVYQTEEPNQLHENNPMISTVNLFQISHDTNNYESSVYQTPELNPSLQQTIENHDSNPQSTQVNKQLEYSDPQNDTVDENVQNSSDSD